MDRILSGTTTSGQSETGSNRNENILTWQSPDLQDWRFTTTCSLVSYVGDVSSDTV